MQALLSPGDNLGLVIRGGAEYGVGIFVIQVDPGSVADKLGLQVNTQCSFSSNKLYTIVLSLVTNCMR